MTITEIGQLLRDQFLMLYPDVPVVFSHQDAPAPGGHYLVIDYGGTWHHIGPQASHQIQGREDLSNPCVDSYSGRIQVWEIATNPAADELGPFDVLQAFIEYLDTDAGHSAFGSNGFSILRTDGPMESPSLKDNQWTREHLLTLECLWARADAGATDYIVTVEVSMGASA